MKYFLTNFEYLATVCTLSDKFIWYSRHYRKLLRLGCCYWLGYYSSTVNNCGGSLFLVFCLNSGSTRRSLFVLTGISLYCCLVFSCIGSIIYIGSASYRYYSSSLTQSHNSLERTHSAHKAIKQNATANITFRMVSIILHVRCLQIPYIITSRDSYFPAWYSLKDYQIIFPLMTLLPTF
jgi:hypothetical protein